MGPDVGWGYDVFISYSHADRAWVHSELLSHLEEAGLKVCIDDRDFRVGAPRVTEMERAVVTSRHTVLVLTPAYLASDWAKFETLVLQTLDPANEHLRLIPLLRERCELPIRITLLTPVDFADPVDPSQAWTRLLNALGAPSINDVPKITMASRAVQRPVVQLGRRWDELVQELKSRHSLAAEYAELSDLVGTITRELQRPYLSESDFNITAGWQRGMEAVSQFREMSSQNRQLRNLLMDMRIELAQRFLEASERSHHQQRWQEALLLSKQALALNPNSSDAFNIQEYAAEALRRKDLP